MNIRKLQNGDLAMQADVNERRDIKQLQKTASNELAAEARFIIDFLTDPMGDGVCYTQVAPEEIGALTSAPLISDGEDIYGFMDYAIRNFLEDLAAGKEVVWKKG